MREEASFGFWLKLACKGWISEWEEIRPDLCRVVLANGLQMYYIVSEKELPNA